MCLLYLFPCKTSLRGSHATLMNKRSSHTVTLDLITICRGQIDSHTNLNMCCSCSGHSHIETLLKGRFIFRPKTNSVCVSENDLYQIYTLTESAPPTPHRSNHLSSCAAGFMGNLSYWEDDPTYEMEAVCCLYRWVSGRHTGV